MIYVIDTPNTTSERNLVTGHESVAVRWVTHLREDLPVVVDRVGRRFAVTRLTFKHSNAENSMRLVLGGIPVSKRNSKLLDTDHMMPSFIDLEDPLAAWMEVTAPRDGESNLEGIMVNGIMLDHAWFVEYAQRMEDERAEAEPEPVGV